MDVKNLGAVDVPVYFNKGGPQSRARKFLFVDGMVNFKMNLKVRE